MKVSSILAFLALLLTGGIAALAADFGGLDLRPLLLVRESKKTTFGVGPVNGALEEEHSLFVTRGGATTLALVTRQDPNEWQTKILRGVGTGPELANLTQALGDSKIGRLQSCSKKVAEGLEARYEITWFGWNNRTSKAISVIYSSAPAPSSASCPASLDTLIQGIGDYERDFAANFDTSVDR
ncbi:MAG: hypothetical protein ACJ76Y_12210 [Thermoanaerobaculia bacterium]